MTRPNFFLLGAPKSGSTALYSYLNDHPEIYLPQLKEPRYFAKDFGDFREITNLDEYENLFSQAPDTAKIIGDGSPWYLCSALAISAIRTYAPKAKAIVILRNPLEMLPSLHNQYLFSFKETEKDLQKAWILQEARNCGDRLPPSSPAPSLLQYGPMTRFGDQLERLMAIWPANNLQVVLFDDFRQNTASVYRSTLSFLELKDDNRTSFPVINEAARHRNQAIGWVINSPTSPFYRGMQRLRRYTGLRSTGLLSPFFKGNRTKQSKKQIQGAFRTELIEYYRDDINKLGRLLDRDLSHWLR